MPEPLPSIQVIDPREDTLSHILESSPCADAAVRPKSSSSEGTTFRPHPSPVKYRNVPLVKSNVMSKPASPGPPRPSGPTTMDRPPTTIDPLSHHILKRTNTENTIPQRLRQTERSENTNTEAAGPAGADGAQSHRIDQSKAEPTSKEKKKGVSFLSRFGITGGKKKELEDVDDDESEQGDRRPEGMNAHVFSSSVGANGYIPQHKEPPRYIKVRAHNKKEKEFNRMFLAQELGGDKAARGVGDDKVLGETDSDGPATEAKPVPQPLRSGNAIWATEFSKDGKYLAAAGQDQIVRIWAVLSTHGERDDHEKDEDARIGRKERLSAPVFASKPIREFEGHTSTVLDLSWSKNNFLLSSSMDKTVRLWHVSRQECLCTFKHKDFVTSIAFHPKDDRFFLAGSLDAVLRLWSIPDKNVAFWSQLPDLITAVAFSPDGKTAMAGVLSGLCLFYETEELKFQTQIHVRSSRGKNAKGSKITGIRCCTHPPHDIHGETKVLITTNDSRIRMYNLRDKALEMKFRGNENTCSQIKASMSDDTAYVICGSEDRKAYVWSIASGKEGPEGKEKRPVEMFEAHSHMVTTTTIAPLKTRQLLSQSGDPIYDLCNPPPITLLSRAESNVSSKAPTPNESGEVAVSHSENHASVDPAARRPEESPGYVLRSRHEDGNIIVTADHAGAIKVFRQDCAYQKRRNETWEAGSVFGRKTSTLGRSNSVSSHARKFGTSSRRGSVNVSHRESPLHEKGDRILSWRNGINGDAISLAPSFRYDRSISPGKPQRSISVQTTKSTLATARQLPYTHNPPPTIQPVSPSGTVHTSKSIESKGSKTSRVSFSFSRPQTSSTSRKSSQSERPFLSSKAQKHMPETPSEPPTPGFQLFRSEETLWADGPGKGWGSGTRRA